MFSLSDSDKFYLYPHPTDMRKSFYALSGIVRNEMHRDVQQGDAFIFINRPLTSMKILHMEYGGLVIYNYKLEKGCLRLPDIDFEKEATEHPTEWSDLMLMTHGISPREVKRKPRWKPLKKDEKH